MHESLVLLKNNNNVIPLNPANLKYIVLVGERVININGLARNELFRNFDDIGMQNGGWTLRWQGFEGNSQWQGDNLKSSNASSILDGLQRLGQNVNSILFRFNFYILTIPPLLNRLESISKEPHTLTISKMYAKI